MIIAIGNYIGNIISGETTDIPANGLITDSPESAALKTDDNEQLTMD